MTAEDRKLVLEAAEKAVCHDRNEQYGEPEDNFSIIAQFWGTYLGAEIDAKDVSMMMALLNVARVATAAPGADIFDSLVGIAGYAACADSCSVRETAREEAKKVVGAFCRSM